MTSLDRSVKEQLTESVKNLYEAKLEYERAKKYYEAVKQKETVKINNCFFTSCSSRKTFQICLKDGMNYYNSPKKIRVTKVSPQKFHWNTKELKRKLKKHVYNKIVTRKYVIADYEELVKYLKSCGVDPAVFKSYITAEDKLDMKVFEKEYGIGNIKLSDVEGCYRVEDGEPYLRVAEVET